MYETETGYWVPGANEVILIAEEPHVIRWSGVCVQDGQQVRGITIPHAYRDGLLVGTEFVVKSVSIKQDMHYEYVLVDFKGDLFLDEYDNVVFEIPLRYCKKHPTEIYENTYKKLSHD